MPERTVKILAVLLLVVFALSLLPLLWVSLYDYPATDDFYFAAPVRHVFEDTRSVGAALAEAVRNTVATYRTYQGTFSAVFLWNLMPAVWGERYYGLGAVFLVLAFVLCHAFFFRTTLPRLGFSKWGGVLLAVFLTMLSMQFTYSPREGFFWFNGAVYYNFFYCLFLVFVALLLRYGDGGRRAVPYRVLLPLLAVALGATNYSVALMSAVGYAAYLACLCIKKTVRPLHFVVLGCFAAAMLLSALCPGNAFRASLITGGAEKHASPLTAIAQALLYSAKQCAALLTPEMLGCLLLASPLLLAAARASGASFRLPLLITIASVTFLAVGWTPPMYILGKIRSLRLINIMRYAGTLLLFFNLYYYLGWVQRVLRGARCATHTEKVSRLCRRLLPVPLALGAALFLIGSLRGGRYREYLSVACAGTVVTGNAPAYAEEMQARFEILHDETVPDAVLEPLRHTPWVLAGRDLSDDPLDYLNEEVAVYFRKHSIRIKAD